MNLYKLRGYQQESINLLKKSFIAGRRKPILCLPTGAGKTVIMAHIVKSAIDKGRRVVFVAPYTALINQTSESFLAQGIPQAGIMMADHPLTDPTKRLQIASVQTLARRKTVDADLFIIDECHKLFTKFMDNLKDRNMDIIGVSATPATKGLGKYYDNLLNPVTMKDLINQGYLSSYTVFAPHTPDLTKVKISKGDYQIDDLAGAMSTKQITGNIVKTWLDKANNGGTIAFCVNVSHANFVGSEFDKHGITNEVITAKTPTETRQNYFNAFKKGELKILISVETLIAGLDLNVHCVIHARPTKSKMLWCQSFGRGLRTADDKERLILLDHAGNCERLGFPDDIHYKELDNDTKEEAERKKKEKEDYPEKLPKLCVKCKVMKQADEHKCEACGFEPRKTENVEIIEGELTLIKGKPKTEAATMAEKTQFMSELRGYQVARQWEGKKCSDGYIAHLYKAKFGVWARNTGTLSAEPSESTLGYIKSRQIAFAKSKGAKR